MKRFGKTLYHGTPRRNVRAILLEGLKPTYLGKTIVCMSPTPEAAKNFGEVVLEVNVEGYHVSCFDDCREWERFVWTDKAIPPNRIKVFNPLSKEEGYEEIHSRRRR